jgi:ribokinase
VYGADVTLDARLVVLGSLNMDISVTVRALPAPGATVMGGSADVAPGGKGANQAVAAARLGAGTGLTVAMAGCVGDDHFGRTLRAALTAEDINDRALRTVPGAPTGIAMITVDQAGENMITVAPGANRDVGPDDAAATRDAAVAVISAEIPVPAILAALGTCGAPAAGGDAASRSVPLTVLNLAPAPPEPG